MEQKGEESGEHPGKGKPFPHWLWVSLCWDENVLGLDIRWLYNTANALNPTELFISNGYFYVV